MPRPGPSPQRLSRRSFVAAASVGATSLLAGCDALGLTDPKASGSARLTARPGMPSVAGPRGLRALGLGSALADGVVYVPATYEPATPSPLVLLLHGAGGTASSFIVPFVAEADATGQILLVVDSRKVTWDGVGSGRFGPDIAFLDTALSDTFSRYAVDSARLAVAGFSDGATMALALGLANGDLFPRVAAWSPGGLIGRERRGKPAFYLTHGQLDPVLPIQSTSRVIVSDLRDRGYEVAFTEFLGGHIIPADLLHNSMRWMAGLGA